ncbi:hypothetical protein L6452_32108 [Arctium lappa]|uniref:Uncharacterized protein n=1 Tax=Arctium lappa TaxID=4217 RepID=A0ACB8Z2T2_ARCLA|nr:hypothetical protein L6452_32108 [Arctium lappa]
MDDSCWRIVSNGVLHEHGRITQKDNRVFESIHHVVAYQDDTSLKHLLSLSSESSSFFTLEDALNLFQVYLLIIDEFKPHHNPVLVFFQTNFLSDKSKNHLGLSSQVSEMVADKGVKMKNKKKGHSIKDTTVETPLYKTYHL